MHPYFGQSHAKESLFGKSLLHVPMQWGIFGSSPSSIAHSLWVFMLQARYLVGLA